MKTYYILFVLLLSSLHLSAEKVFPSTIRYSESGLRNAIYSLFPSLETICYHFDGHVMIGVFHDTKNKKIFFIFYPDLPGVINIKINNKPIKLSALEKVDILIAGNEDVGGGQVDPDTTNLGY